ncbi:nitrilase-related carbon-nitrogen hydrolase [Paenibacillus puerhi]|uniref:nitrilase-related carbon-nitrogen hydrolase n=1 Tax=Paenibacillus puerhi TaxID=2692622 RepID=UPI0013598898|nr:nitrilase-related carbon-nitrogen hydrolase [Paenibacillus puerhi]
MSTTHLSTEQSLPWGGKLIAKSWAAISLSLLSGILFVLSMPGSGTSGGPLAWIAFVPLLLAVHGRNGSSYYWLFTLAGIVGSVGIHIWYPDVLGKGLGGFLMVASGFMYGGFLQLGHSLQRQIRSPWRVGVLPTVWTALEWLRFALPVTGDWWIEVLAKSQWASPAPLQLLSITGFAGLSFVIMLANSAIAEALITWIKERRLNRAALLAMLLPIVLAGWGLFDLHSAHQGNGVRAAAMTDLANQDPAIVEAGGKASAGDGYVADTPEMTEAIWKVNTELTMQARQAFSPSVVVWGENEFTDYSNEAMINKLKETARSAQAYLVADVTWTSDVGLHDTALLIGPDGSEIGKTAKINLTDGEKAFGFVPGIERGKVYETALGPVGLAVCWDRHVTGIIRDLARNGSKLVLVPVDDDFRANTIFPNYAASDSVFRAVENRVSLVTGTTSGMSQIINPYGEMIAAGPVNERGYITGETFLYEGKGSVYTQWGDWFAILIVIAFSLLLGNKLLRRGSGRS